MAGKSKEYILITAGRKPEALPEAWEQNVASWVGGVAAKKPEIGVVVPLEAYEKSAAEHPRFKALLARGNIAATAITETEARKIAGKRATEVERDYLAALEQRDVDALKTELLAGSRLRQTQQSQWVEDFGAWAKPLTAIAVIGGLIAGIGYLAATAIKQAEKVGEAKQKRDMEGEERGPRPDPMPGRGR